jgi:hypothetical protein
VLDHRFAADVSEWLAWESGGSVAGGDDGDDRQRL